jgi:hypothetical protein
MPNDRAGPPMPRNDEPWRMPTPPLPEQPGRTPVPASDVAFDVWVRGVSVTDSERALLKHVFRAGWEARKHAQYMGQD